VRSLAAGIVVLSLLTSGAVAATGAARLNRDFSLFSHTAGSPAPRGPRPFTPGNDSTVNAVVPDGHGGWYVGGKFAKIGNVACANAAHVTAAGAPDPGFCPRPNGTVYAMALAGGTLYLGGAFTSVAGATRRYAGAVDAASGHAVSWNPQLTARQAFDRNEKIERNVVAVAVDSGTVYLWGWFDKAAGKVRHGLAAVDARTANLSSWRPAPATDFRIGSAVDGGALYAAPFALGSHSVYLGSRTNLLVVDRSTGDVKTWALKLATASGPGMLDTLALAGTTLYAGGGFRSILGKARNSVAALDASTGALLPWAPSVIGSLAGDPPEVDTLLATGSTLILGGNFVRVAGQARQGLAELDGSGHATGWAPVGPRSGFGFVTALASSGGTIAVGCSGCQ
jgi:trimeric autotransporter adhesin